MDKNKKTSIESIAEATRSVVEFSGHGRSLGASGFRVASDHPENCEFLAEPGDSISVSPTKNGFDSILLGVAWDGIQVTKKKILGKILNKTKKIDVDLDLGCLYELKDGTRGAIQAFGDKYGSFKHLPYIGLSGDERTGETEGHDEYILVNGKHWSEIKRILVYIYIYEGAPTWSHVRPQIVIDVPGENDFYVTLNSYEDNLCLCALAELENIRGGIKLTNRTEFFPGHEEMDRAFGYGLEWADGQKAPHQRK